MRSTLRSVSRSDLALWCAYLALGLYFTWPLLASGNNLGISDWDPLLLFHANVFRSLFEYGQLPFWNPWSCGGNPLWQNPQVALVSPVYLLTLVMPLTVAVKLNVLLHYLVGFAGMHLLLVRVFRIAFRPAILMLSSMFVLAGGEALHLMVGHLTFLPYFYLPWVGLFFVRGLQTGGLRFAVATATVLALGVYVGGIHMTFMSAVSLGCLSIVSAAGRRDWRPLAFLGATGALTALFAAPKLVPVGHFVTDPRLVDIRNILPKDVMSAEMLVHAFMDPFQYLRQHFDGQNYLWHEYGNYITSFGLLVIGAAFFAIVLSRPWQRRHWLGLALAATTLLLFLLTIGEFGPYAPFELLRRVPLAGQFRIPSRYTLVFVFFGTSMVAWVIRGLPAAPSVSLPVVRYFGIVLVLASCLLAYRNRVAFEGTFTLKPAKETFHFLSRPPAPAIDPDTDGFSGDAPMMRATLRGQAVLRCNDSLLLSGSVRPDQPVVFSDSVRISDVRFSPNRIEFRAITRDGGRVYLNQRYVAGWRGHSGTLGIDPANGLAYMMLPPGSAGRFAFSFAPAGLWTGAFLLLAGLGLSVLVWPRSLGGAPVTDTDIAAWASPL